MGLGKELTGSGGAIALTIASAKRLWLAAGPDSPKMMPRLTASVTPDLNRREHGVVPRQARGACQFRGAGGAAMVIAPVRLAL